MVTEREEILKIAIDMVTEEIDRFVTACTDEKGNPKAPTPHDLMRIRGCLPSCCKNTAYRKLHE